MTTHQIPYTESPGMFQDHTIDVEVRGEEPVLAKQARIKEEVVVGKTAEERRETVSDTVRHTEVDVEDERSGRAPARKREPDSDPL
jgi:stress response protein YsnF